MNTMRAAAALVLAGGLAATAAGCGSSAQKTGGDDGPPKTVHAKSLQGAPLCVGKAPAHGGRDLLPGGEGDLRFTGSKAAGGTRTAEVSAGGKTQTVKVGDSVAGHAVRQVCAYRVVVDDPKPPKDCAYTAGDKTVPAVGGTLGLVAGGGVTRTKNGLSIAVQAFPDTGKVHLGTVCGKPVSQYSDLVLGDTVEVGGDVFTVAKIDKGGVDLKRTA